MINGFFSFLEAETDLVISVKDLVWFLGAATAIIIAIKAIFKPFKEIEDHDKRLDKMEKSVAYIAKAVNALVNHAIDGNDIEKLKNAREEYQNHMLNHDN